MDDIVKAAMIKWPNVPHCHGWLGLDARGHWWLRDADAQRAGPFAGTGANSDSKGSQLRHEKLIEFIGRNYACDVDGQWYFQNGPQRVYVELERAPWVLRVEPTGVLVTHCGEAVNALAVWADEHGHVYVHTERGLGAVHSQDMHAVADALERGDWQLQASTALVLAEQFGFVRSPQAKFDLSQGV